MKPTKQHPNWGVLAESKNSSRSLDSLFNFNFSWGQKSRSCQTGPRSMGPRPVTSGVEVNGFWWLLLVFSGFLVFFVAFVFSMVFRSMKPSKQHLTTTLQKSSSHFPSLQDIVLLIQLLLLSTSALVVFEETRKLWWPATSAGGFFEACWVLRT